jgi:hypothetical protein
MRALAVFVLGGVLAAPIPAKKPPVTAAQLAFAQRSTPQRPAPQPAPARQPAREATVPFRVGETLTFDVSWSNFLIAGTATAKVVEKKASRNAMTYALLAEGRPRPLIERLYPVYYKMESLLDTTSLLPQWTGLYTEERGRKKQTTMFFDRSRQRVFYEVPTEPGLKDEFAHPAGAQDGLATLYVLRSRALRSGEKFSLPIADDGALYTVEFTTTGPERVSVPFGETMAFNVRIQITNAEKQEVGRNIGAWIGTDARRLPLKLEAELPVGKFILALREAP